MIIPDIQEVARYGEIIVEGRRSIAIVRASLGEESAVVVAPGNYRLYLTPGNGMH